MKDRGAKTGGPRGLSTAANNAKQPQKLARIIGFDLESDRTVRTLAAVQNKAGGFEPGSAHGTYFQRAEIESVGAGREIE